MDQSIELFSQLRDLRAAFEKEAAGPDTRARVQRLIPVFETLRDLGRSLVPSGLSLSARDRLLKCFLSYPKTVLQERELAIVAGISEWARRVRELRVEFGWRIITGMTTRHMLDESELAEGDI